MGNHQVIGFGFFFLLSLLCCLGRSRLAGARWEQVRPCPAVRQLSWWIASLLMKHSHLPTLHLREIMPSNYGNWVWNCAGDGLPDAGTGERSRPTACVAAPTAALPDISHLWWGNRLQLLVATTGGRFTLSTGCQSRCREPWENLAESERPRRARNRAGL